MLGSAKLKRIQIDRYVMDKFTEARRQRLPVKDFTLQQWAMECNDTVCEVKYSKQIDSNQLLLLFYCIRFNYQTSKQQKHGSIDSKRSTELFLEKAHAFCQ